MTNIQWLDNKIIALFEYMRDTGKDGLTHDEQVAFSLMRSDKAILKHVMTYVDEKICNTKGVNFFNVLGQEPQDWLAAITDEVKTYVRDNNIEVRYYIPATVEVYTYIETKANPFTKEDTIRINALNSPEFGVAGNIEQSALRTLQGKDNPNSPVFYHTPCMLQDKKYYAPSNKVQTNFEIVKDVRHDGNEN